MATANDKISSFDNLLKSERKIACGKRKKREVAKFEQDLGYNISKLSDELKRGKYRVSKYHSFKVYEPKERNIQALRFRDRVVQNCICEQLLRPWLEPRLVFDNSACRRDKGPHFALRRLTGFLADFYKHHGADGWALKIDIRKYFDNIDHEVLKQKLMKFPTRGGRELLCNIVDGYHKDTGKGLPLGNQSSQWFALYYLNGLDRLIKEKYRIKYYTRYMDDMVIIHHDREFLKTLLKALRQYARDELKLEFNEKTEITPLRQGIDYLGFRFYLGKNGKVVRRLRGSAKTRLKGNLKRLQYSYANYLMDWDDVKVRLESYRAHISHGHTYRLYAKALSKLKFVRKF